MNENPHIITHGPSLPAAVLFPTRESVARTRILEVALLPKRYAKAHSSELSGVIEQLCSKKALVEEFYDLTHEAQTTIDTTCHALAVLKEAATIREHEIIQRQGDQQRRAMDVIKEIQELARANGSAQVLQAVIDSVNKLVEPNDFGLGENTVQQARVAALDQLRQKYEQAVVAEMGLALRAGVNEIYGMFDQADGMIEEGTATDEEIILAVCHHFGWDKEATINRLKAINFNQENK